MSDEEFKKFSDSKNLGNVSIAQFFDYDDFDKLSRGQIDEIFIKIYNQGIDAKNQLQPLVDQISSLSTPTKDLVDVSDLEKQILQLNEENSKLSKLLLEAVSNSPSEKTRIVKVRDKTLFFSGLAYAKQLEKKS
jgi:hypothetical protein